MPLKFTGVLGLFLVLIESVKVVSAAESSATNKTDESKVPALTLGQALQTNMAGTYRVAPALTGAWTTVIASGAFVRPEPEITATNRQKVRLDAVVIVPKGSVGRVGPRALAHVEKEGGYSALHTVRDSLPADAEIRRAAERGVGAIERLLGPAQGFPHAAGRGLEPWVRSSWSYCDLKGDGAVETLKVTAIFDRRDKDARVESLEVRRAKASPELPPKK